MKSKVFVISVVMLFAVNIVSAATVTTDTFVSSDGQSQFTIDFVTISGDTNPTSGYGQVTGDYRMGVYEITNDQYAKFASNNPYFTGGSVAANMVSWFEAAQFVNYLNTSTGHQAAYKFTADVMGVWQDGEDGYDATNPFRNSNAKYFLPTEDEWVKAAYWNGTSLQTYATKPGESLTQGDGLSGTGWNYYDSVYSPRDVYSGSAALHGTYDMMGHVWEWMESNYDGDFSSGSYRGVRGGSSGYGDDCLSSSDRFSSDPDIEFIVSGFRVASEVPEPCSLVLLLGGGLILRRRKR